MCISSPIPYAGMKTLIKTDNSRWILSSNFGPSRVSLWLLYFWVGRELDDHFSSYGLQYLSNFCHILYHNIKNNHCLLQKTTKINPKKCILEDTHYLKKGHIRLKIIPPVKHGKIELPFLPLTSVTWKITVIKPQMLQLNFSVAWGLRERFT